MPHNFGKMHYELIRDGEAAYGLPTDEEGRPWGEVVKEIETPQGAWYIAVGDDGWIFAAERDPSLISMVGVDLWMIESDFGHEDLREHYWDGERINGKPFPLISLAPERFYGWLESTGKLQAFIDQIEAVDPFAKRLTCRNQFASLPCFRVTDTVIAEVAPRVWGDNWREKIEPGWRQASGETP